MKVHLYFFTLFDSLTRSSVSIVLDPGFSILGSRSKVRNRVKGQARVFLS